MLFLVAAILPGIGVVFFARALLDAQARNLITSSFKSKHTLPEPPTRLSRLSIITIFVLVVLKYILQPLFQLVGISAPLRYDRSTRTFALPYAEISAPVSVTEQDSLAYSLATSQSARPDPDSGSGSDSTSSDGHNPIFLLTPLTSPLLLLLLSKQTNPILPLGAVNVRNRFEFHDPPSCQNLRLRGRAGVRLTVHAHVGGPQSPGRRVKRGMEFDVSIFVVKRDYNRDGGEEERVIFSYIFTVLQRLSGPPAKDAPPVSVQRGDDAELEPAPAAEDQEQPKLTIHYDSPSRWAKLCKDYNPIHISAAAARLFGFSSKIAHGNMVVGMVLGIVGAAAASTNEIISSDAPFWLEASFRRPMPLHRLSSRNLYSVTWLVPHATTNNDSHRGGSSVGGVSVGGVSVGGSGDKELRRKVTGGFHISQQKSPRKSPNDEEERKVLLEACMGPL